MDLLIRDVMTQHPTSIREKASIADAARLLLDTRASEIYVTDAKGRLKGVVPEYEFLKAHLAAVSDGDRVELLMSPNFSVVNPDDNVTSVAVMLRDRRNARIAVTENGILVGQICVRVVLRLLIETRQMQTDIESATSDRVETETSASTSAQKELRPAPLRRILSQTAALS